MNPARLRLRPDRWMRWLLGLVWALYFLLFARFLKGGSGSRDASWAGWAGMALQFAAVGLALAFQRVWATDWRAWAGLGLCLAALALSWAALKRLGEQWKVGPEVAEGHRLVTEGPYAWIRHPLYMAFFLLTAGTGLAVARWWALAGAVALSLAGARVRIKGEEAALREEFADEFKEYARRVPGMFPKILR